MRPTRGELRCAHGGGHVVGGNRGDFRRVLSGHSGGRTRLRRSGCGLWRALVYCALMVVGVPVAWFAWSRHQVA